MENNERQTGTKYVERSDVDEVVRCKDLRIHRRTRHSMSDVDRNSQIDAYFDAMDAEDLEIVRPALGEDFVYESLGGDLEGFSGLETYMEELRSLSNTTHEVTLRIHDEDASVAEGTVTGEGEDGPVEAKFCNVFEFGPDGGITRIGVYLNDA
jgi:ketosteroid isomerase-like protein